MNEITPILLKLLDIQEVVWLLGAFFFVVWILLAAVLVIILLHTLYVLRGASRLYWVREPVPGWSRRFYPASVLLIGLILFVQWMTFQLLQGVVPFT